MVETKNGSKNEVEDKEKIQHIASQILEPALQEALAEARKQGSAQEVLSAMANCYGGLLVDILGRKAAATFLQGHAIHLASREE